ncbi:hypothetical protein [Nocardia carnea]|uniref:hypothetical protein n=1 Tax=Nocardia carnea TaxID=37328 RepID=UPI00031183EB|nr:hypothetical protein [Nocardia carnea]
MADPALPAYSLVLAITDDWDPLRNHLLDMSTIGAPIGSALVSIFGATITLALAGALSTRDRRSLHGHS